MTITHTNRKSTTDYLPHGTTTKGNPKYFFDQHDKGDLVDSIPPGYEIDENPTAQLFLRKKWAKIISDKEVETVKAGVR